MFSATSRIFLLLCLPLHAEVTAVAHPEQEFPPDRTVVWTPLFQAAWDRLNDHHGGKPHKVEPSNPLISQLDSFRWESEKVMPDAGWKTWAGPATPDFLETVNPEAMKVLKRDQPVFPPADLSPEEQPGAVAVYGVLSRSISFEKPFSRSRKVPLSFRGPDHATSVHFFGTRGRESAGYSGSVKVLAWRPADRSCALQIKADGDETLVLYLPPERQSFAKACHWLRTWRESHRPDETKAGAWNDPALHEHDEIQAPYVGLESSTDFAPLLQSHRFYKGQPLPRRIAKAELRTRFELHEKGAKVEASVEILDPFAEGHETHPRRFHFDRPFFAFLWREKTPWPYFGVWVGDASCLEEWK